MNYISNCCNAKINNPDHNGHGHCSECGDTCTPALPEYNLLKITDMINLINRIIDESNNREAYENGEISAEERERRDEEARINCRAAIERDEAAEEERIRQQLRDMGAEVDDRAARMVLWVMQSGKGFNYRKNEYLRGCK